VRRGRYLIAEIFNPRSVYGRWGYRGTIAYLVTIVVMIPFMVTTPFTGFVAQAAGGVDYSMFIGLPLAGILYWVLCRNLDLDAEKRLVAEEGVLTGHGSVPAEQR
jgi:NCS1 family nucleobase:cation symporter-1